MSLYMDFYHMVTHALAGSDADKEMCEMITEQGINKILDAAVEAMGEINGATFTCKNRQAPIVVIVERSWKEGKHIRRDDAIKAINKLRQEK